MCIVIIISSNIFLYCLVGRLSRATAQIGMESDQPITEPTVKDLDQDAGSEVIETESLCLNCQENVRTPVLLLILSGSLIYFY